MQRSQRLQLPAVMLGVIVHFAQQHNRASGRLGDDLGPGNLSPAWHDPIPDRGALDAFFFLVIHFRLR